MPIKTIQPFVSNFNAFAGEGFYGNVVQGLVIKQLEDAVFIFGIAIDGTLIFRKRNYPDVSTWEDPKIIIHSNNWHKIYFVTDLGELIGTATGNKSGLMSVEDKKILGRRFFKGYTKLVESKYWYNHYVALIFGASPASNLGSLIAIDWKGNELISVTRFFGNNDNVKLYLGSNPETNMYELWLGLIGLDGDGSEFIIQSRESIDLDSKTVETLPSYLKVISISWQKNNDFSELGELIGINETWFRNRGYIRGEINLDDFKNAGAYSLFNVEGNNVPTSWAQLLIFSSGYYIIQIIVDISSRKLFIRRYDTENDRWQEWGNIIIT